MATGFRITPKSSLLDFGIKHSPSAKRSEGVSGMTKEVLAKIMFEQPSSLEQLIAALKREAASGDKALPPVDKWNPAHCGDIGMEILADGTWKHEGTRITRESLVKLFASILRKDEDGQTYLVTPVEKIVVKVEDAPFTAIRADRHGEGRDQTIVFTTNTGDIITAGPDHSLRVDRRGEEPRPYVHVRGRLEARVLRAPFYELVEWAEPKEGRLGVWSGGVWWELGSH